MRWSSRGGAFIRRKGMGESGGKRRAQPLGTGVAEETREVVRGRHEWGQRNRVTVRETGRKTERQRARDAKAYLPASSEEQGEEERGNIWSLSLKRGEGVAQGTQTMWCLSGHRMLGWPSFCLKAPARCPRANSSPLQAPSFSPGHSLLSSSQPSSTCPLWLWGLGCSGLAAKDGRLALLLRDHKQPISFLN